MNGISETFHQRTILVTGGAGMVGNCLVHALEALEPKKIVLVDNLSSSYEWNLPRGPRVQFIRGDILDEEVLKRAFKEHPHFVYHLAAHFANQNSVDHPETDLMVNGMGTLKVLEYANLQGVDRFVYASSGCGIYGPDNPMPFTEDHVSTHLYTPYQVTKMLGELYTNYFHNLYEMPVVNARFFNAFGPGEVPGRYRNVIPNFLFWGLKGQPLPITGNGEETRDFTFVGDIVKGLLACAVYDKAVGEAINLASGRETKIIDLATWINELTKNEAGIVFKERRNWDKKNRLVASIEKARRILRYEPKVDVKTGLREAHSWFKENWGRINESAEF